MAVFINQEKGNLKIILRRDDSIKATEEEYEAYVESGLDESKLTFVAGKEPTRFVMRRNLDYSDQQTIMKEQIQIEKSKKGKGMDQRLSISFIMDEVRAALVDIENPTNVPEEQHIKFKADSDQKASFKLISMLQGAGIVMDLYSVRQQVLEGKGQDVEAVKKS